MALTDAQKTELMRKGNELFNRGQYFEAGKIFNVIGYKTGLIRLGDLFYFDKEMPLVAYGFYRNANHRPMLDKIGEGFVFALKCLLYEPGAGEGKSAAAQPKPAAFKKLRPEGGEEQYRIRQANSPDAVSSSAATPESIDSKVARAVAMLQKLA